MKLLIVISLVAVLGMATAQNATECAKNYWGPNCVNVCGECYIPDKALVTDRVCNVDTGACASGCLGGYTGTKCSEAICDGGCGPGQCLAPNYCGNCGDISRVSPKCEDIRLRGLLGALCAFLVIGISITLCGFGSVWYKKRKNTAVAL